MSLSPGDMSFKTGSIRKLSVSSIIDGHSLVEGSARGDSDRSNTGYAASTRFGGDGIPHIELLGLRTRFSLSSGEALIDEATARGGVGGGTEQINSEHCAARKEPANFSYSLPGERTFYGPDV